MLKKSFSTVACMDMSYKQIISLCKKYQIEGVEVRLGNNDTVCGFDINDDLDEFNSAMLENKISITNLGSSVCFVGYDEEKIKKLFCAVDIAKTVKSKAVRVFLGNFSRTVDLSLPFPDHEGIVKALKICCEYAKKNNIEIWIETHNEYATGKALSKVISDVDFDNVKIIWDIIHPIEDGEKIEETWKYIGNKIAHIHIKDGKKRKDKIWHDYEYTRLGAGELPIADTVKLAVKNGYDGYYSLEWESFWRDELKKLNLPFESVLNEYNEIMNGVSI